MNEANTVQLATEVSSDFQRTMFYRQVGGTAWPKVGDRESQPLLAVPNNFYKRTVWCVMNSFGGTTWFWQGRLVARMGGVITFQMPLIFAAGGSATRHSLTIGYDVDNTGVVCEDKIQVNDASGVPLIPFTFFAAAQTISLEEDISLPGTFETRMVLAVLSQSIW